MTAFLPSGLAGLFLALVLWPDLTSGNNPVVSTLLILFTVLFGPILFLLFALLFAGACFADWLLWDFGGDRDG